VTYNQRQTRDDWQAISTLIDVFLKFKTDKRPWHRIGCSLLLLLFSLSTASEGLTVAVASNFRTPMQRLVGGFEQGSDHQVKLVVGSSGKLFAQVTHGAPYDLLFSADQKMPALLAAQGLANAGSQFTYAVGGLVLWSGDSGRVDSQGRVLHSNDFFRLAIANPKIAPYGVAAVQVLQRLGLYDQVEARLVLGANIAQTYQFVSSGNAQLGLVARSQVLRPGQLGDGSSGSAWVVPDHLYEPIRQDAILLNRAIDNPAAAEFMDFIKGQQAGSIITAFGYQLDIPG